MTFFKRKSALQAQDALHNIKTLNGVSSITLSNIKTFYRYFRDYTLFVNKADIRGKIYQDISIN